MIGIRHKDGRFEFYVVRDHNGMYRAKNTESGMTRWASEVMEAHAYQNSLDASAGCMSGAKVHKVRLTIDVVELSL